MPFAPKHYRITKSLLLVATLIAVAVAAFPWKSLVEKRLIAMVEAKGFQHVQLTVSTLGLKGITLKNVSIGNAAPLVLEEITVGYSVSDLWHGEIHALTMNGLKLDARYDTGTWTITGLENASPAQSGPRVLLPVTSRQLAGARLSDATLENSSLHITSSPWQLDIPLALKWQMLPVPGLTYQAKDLMFKLQDLEVSTGDASLNAVLKEPDKKWEGTWEIKDIRLKGWDMPIPLLQGKGTLVAHAEDIALRGGLTSADNTYGVNFSLQYPLNAPPPSPLFTLVEVHMPWSGGTVSTRNVKIPLSTNAPIHAKLKIEHVSVDALLQTLTGKRASATGTVSGTLPMTLGRDGTLTFQQGNLQADKPGTITMSPDAIPGDNEQVTVVREVLKNLHYTHLSIGVNSDKGNKLSVLLVLEGNNPDVYSGRPVKLNVHLRGDMLGLLQQSIMPFINPETLLQ